MMTLIVATTVMTAAGIAGAASDIQRAAQRASVHLSGSPSNPGFNPRTHTLYVPIQCSHTNSCPNQPTGRVLDIIDTSKCNPQVVSRCRVVGQAAGGKGPLDVVVDQKTDTIYVIDGLGAVSVLDGARCNASARTHCGVLATIKLEGFDVAGALNPRTHTLYVASPFKSGDVFAINVSRCNALTTAGCRQTVRKVKDPRGPGAVAVDEATNTVYVADGGTNSPGDTVTVIKGATCDATSGAGCRNKPRTIKVGSAPFWLTVDQATETVYVANNNDGTVSVINGAVCNGTVSSGCHRRPRAVGTGGGVSYMALDSSRHTLFVLNQTDGTMSAINTSTCNGHRPAGCPGRARNAWLPWKPPVGYNPGEFALVPGTGTAYLVNGGGEAFLAADSIKHCNALTTKGCRVEAPSVPSVDLTFPVVDAATGTLYSGSHTKPFINVLNASTCNISKSSPSGCRPVARIPFTDPQANMSAVDPATHTLYAADPYANTISVIDTQHCNAHDTAGCSAAAPKLTVGPGPGVPVLNPLTHTLYFPEAENTPQGMTFNRIGVLDAATCNAKVTAGCGQTPATMAVGMNTFVIAVSVKTDTIYAPSQLSSNLGRRVWVINGATCNATNHSGCASHAFATVKAGLGTDFVAVNDRTNTAYIANNADGDHPGSVSIIDERTCNGSHTAGCSKPLPSIPVGRSPLGLAVDEAANRIYVADYSHAAVSVINGSTCDAEHLSGCHRPAPEQPVGSQPFVLVVDHRTKTVYVTSQVLYRGQPGAGMSLLHTSP